MTNTAIAKTQTSNAPATQQTDPWLKVAAEAGSNPFGKLLKFVKGKWEIGDDEIPLGTEFVAHIDQLHRGWTKFKDGEVVDSILVKVADGNDLPEREELDDLDQTKWERDGDGKPRDPWVKQWYLPLVSLDVGDVCTFVTSSAGGNSCIANLCRIYGNQQRKDLLPIITLKTRSYNHKKYKRIETPDFGIGGWHPSGQSAMTMTAANPKAGPAAAVNADMDDEIPF